jgi:hypothetical protein
MTCGAEDRWYMFIAQLSNYELVKKVLLYRIIYMYLEWKDIKLFKRVK